MGPPAVPRARGAGPGPPGPEPRVPGDVRCPAALQRGPTRAALLDLCGWGRPGPRRPMRRTRKPCPPCCCCGQWRSAGTALSRPDGQQRRGSSWLGADCAPRWPPAPDDQRSLPPAVATAASLLSALLSSSPDPLSPQTALPGGRCRGARSTEAEAEAQATRPHEGDAHLCHLCSREAGPGSPEPPSQAHPAPAPATPADTHADRGFTVSKTLTSRL